MHEEASMRIYPLPICFLIAWRSATISLIGIVVVGAAINARAQQAPKYNLDAGGQNIPLEGISFGSGGAAQPESGAATLRRHLGSGVPSLSDLARSRTEPKLFLRFRDPGTNGNVQYNFDDVKFGRYRQIGTGPDAVETLDITYDAFAVSTPGTQRRSSNGSRGVAHAPHKAAHSAPRRQMVRAGTVHQNTKKQHGQSVR